MDDKNKYDTVENISFNHKKYLQLCKKNKFLSIDGVSKDGYHKIRLNKNNKSKIIWYVREGKVCPVILWSTLINCTCRVHNLEECKKLIKTVVE